MEKYNKAIVKSNNNHLLKYTDNKQKPMPDSRAETCNKYKFYLFKNFLTMLHAVMNSSYYNCSII